MALLNDNINVHLFTHSHVRTAFSACHIMVLTKVVANDKLVELAAAISSYHKPTEINNMLRYTQHNLTTDRLYDTITQHIFNGANVMMLDEGTHLDIETHPTKLIIESTATSGLSHYFTHI